MGVSLRACTQPKGKAEAWLSPVEDLEEDKTAGFPTAL